MVEDRLPRFVRLGWWMPSLVGVWRYWGHGIIFVSCCVIGLKGKEKKRCCLCSEIRLWVCSSFGDF